MKLKKGLFSVVFLLAISSVMAAMSYSSAAVSNDMTVSLVDTNNALLALEASEEHNAAFYGSHPSTANQLAINLNKGKDNVEYGVQPRSEYKWNNLFKVTNNSEHSVTVTIKTDPAKSGEGRISLFASADGTSWSSLLGIHSEGTGLTFTLGSGEYKEIDIKTEALNGRVNTRNLNLIVEAEKQ